LENVDSTKPCVVDDATVVRADAFNGDQGPLKVRLAQMATGGNFGICAIGGSITAGEVAPWYDIDKTFVGRTFNWFRNTFPKSTFELHNAAISGTETSLAAQRVGAFITTYKCDIMIVEFAVNDNGNSKANPGWVEVEYGKLLDQITTFGAIPVSLETMLPDCESAQNAHYPVYAARNLPLMVSESDAICQMTKDGTLKQSDWNADGTHPNTYGHELLALLLTKNFERLIPGHQ
jgi:lysophospholipase L1-like esterase